MLTKKSQVWLETVIYTLMGLGIIALLLAIIKPAIDEKKDNLILEQSIGMLKTIETAIEDVRYYGPGNTIPVEITIKKGDLKIYPASDKIEFSMRSKAKYSEPGMNVSIGRITATTIKKGSDYDVYLMLNYSAIDISYNNKDQVKDFSPASTPYKLGITNNGIRGSIVNIDISS